MIGSAVGWQASGWPGSPLLIRPGPNCARHVRLFSFPFKAAKMLCPLPLRFQHTVFRSCCLNLAVPKEHLHRIEARSSSNSSTPTYFSRTSYVWLLRIRPYCFRRRSSPRSSTGSAARSAPPEHFQHRCRNAAQERSPSVRNSRNSHDRRNFQLGTFLRLSERARPLSIHHCRPSGIGREHNAPSANGGGRMETGELHEHHWQARRLSRQCSGIGCPGGCRGPCVNQ